MVGREGGKDIEKTMATTREMWRRRDTVRAFNQCDAETTTMQPCDMTRTSRASAAATWNRESGRVDWVVWRKLGDVPPSCVIRTNNMLLSWDSRTMTTFVIMSTRRQEVVGVEAEVT